MSNAIKYESMDEGDVRFYLKDANIIQYRSLVGYTMQNSSLETSPTLSFSTLCRVRPKVIG